MKRDLTAYIVFSVLIIFSVSFYFITKEAPSENAVITGEYDMLWAETETTAEEKTVTNTAYTEICTTEDEYVFIDINTATAEELKKLDGIGDAIAVRIIAYRNASGGFKNTEEILCVSGIGERTFSQIKNHIYVENPVYPTQSTEPVMDSEAATEVLTEPVTQNYTEEPPVIQETTVALEIKYNLNTVTADELMKIPGIDAELAENIIMLRTSIDYFSNVLELLYAEGMNKDLYNQICDYFYVENIK